MRKEQNDDDMSVSDMDCSDDEATPGGKGAIEMNVKIPQMQPRVIHHSTRPNRTRMVGPRRVSPGRFQPLAPARLATPVELNSRPNLRQPPPKIVEQKSKNVAEAFANDEPSLGPVPASYNIPELQEALEAVSKELERYKLTCELKSEGTYWLTLVKEGVPSWGLVDAISEFIEPLPMPDSNPQEERLNDAAITEIMTDLNRKKRNEVEEGVTAWKNRPQKVNKMFLARTIKVTIVGNLIDNI